MGNQAVLRLQRACACGAVPASVGAALRAPGRPLERETRESLEPRFGRDLASVRIHDDAEAAHSARAVNALAYTVNQHIVFDTAQYAPRSAPGLRLLAHELAHTFQQGAEPIARTDALAISRPGDAGELEADATADAVMRGAGPVATPVPTRSAPILATQPRHGRSQAPACPSATIHLRPVFFRSTAPGPTTGATWTARLAAANSVWSRCGLHIVGARPRIVTDPAHTTAGDSGPALIAFQLAHQTAGSGPEIFFLDNDLAFVGGGATNGVGNAAKIMISDRGANVRLLAHELGHAMGFADWIHFAPYARGTVMKSTGSNNIPNADVITGLLCNMLTQPPPNVMCVQGDPDPGAPRPAP